MPLIGKISERSARVRSVHPVFQFANEFAQQSCPFRETGKNLKRRRGMFFCFTACSGYAAEGDVCCFLRCGVRAYGLAEIFDAGRAVEDVVDNLEGESKMMPGFAQVFAVFLSGIRAVRTHAEGGGKKSGGFVGVDIMKRFGVRGKAGVSDIFHLATD